jgi:hypothetical protein
MFRQISSFCSAFVKTAQNVSTSIRARFDSHAADDPIPAVRALLAAQTLPRVRELLQVYPVLLDPRTAIFLSEGIDLTSAPPYWRDHIDRLVWILGQCREKGVNHFFAETQPLANVAQHLTEKSYAPRDLNSMAAEDSAPETESTNTLAAQLISAYRGDDYVFGEARAREIKGAGGDAWLQLLTKQITTEQDWTEAARKMEGQQLTFARKYVSEVAKRYADDERISRIGVQFIQYRTPNAFAIHVAEDNSFAIGIDPGLYSLFSLLFHAGNVSLYRGEADDFIDLLVDLVKLNYLGLSVPGLEERILRLNDTAGVFEQHWANLAAQVGTQFLIGHEIGHIHLNHFDNHQPPRIQMLPDQASEAELAAFDRDLEFEADRWSAGELIRAAKTVNSHIGSWAMPTVFLTLASLLEDVYPPRDPVGKIQQQTHPPAWERAQALREIGRAAIPGGFKRPPEVERLLAFPDTLNSIRSSARLQDAASRVRSLAKQPTTRS